MKLILTDFYHQATARFINSLNQAKTSFLHVNVTSDGWLPEAVESPFLHYTGFAKLPDKALHYNELSMPDFLEIRNLDGAKAEIRNGEIIKGIIFYQPDTTRLVREVQWLNRAGKLRLTERYNRQGAKFADSLFDAEGKELKTIYFDASGEKIITLDEVTKAVILKTGAHETVFANVALFVAHYLRERLSVSADKIDELVFNSLSTPLFASNLLSELPGTLYFQEVIHDAVPGNMLAILEGKTPTTRILFENAKELEKVAKLAPNRAIALDYLGAIENFTRENRFRPHALTITRSDQILYDEAVAEALAARKITWTIAAPSEISDKLRAFGETHDNVTVLEQMPFSKIDDLLAENDYYLDLNQGADTQNTVQRAYQEGLLVIADMTTQKNAAYELLLENEKEICDVLRRPNQSIVLNVLRNKKGAPATVSDYRAMFK
ncbi:MAG: hypothetical protein LBI11_01395 [Streptococcaceae bacterium]|jgi:accessory Sec system glycosyltransferase GtfB|nr:hypothetical protein [Streptococcaceae bacterium]